jgi:hypothetical protein
VVGGGWWVRDGRWRVAGGGWWVEGGVCENPVRAATA